MLALAEDDAVALGEALRAAGYGSGSSILGSTDGAVLRRLWSVGAGVPRADVERALGPRVMEALESAGIVRADGERVRSSFRVTPLEGLLFLHDRADPQGPGDQVASVGPASATLANLMVRRPVARALDLGTGCGVSALIASRFAEHVVATDVNERALATAAINAHLNGVTNVEFRRGDLFEPVRGEEFDLIATNPPFVISPETSQVYRDSGLEGDSLSKQVVGLAAEHLAPGGFATVLCEWILREGEEWVDVPRGWVADGGCDALVLHYRTADPEAYATGWNTQLRAADPDAYAEAVEAWAAYQRGLGAVGVSTGAVILRRPVDGDPWFRAEEMPHGPQGAASDQILRLFASQARRGPARRRPRTGRRPGADAAARPPRRRVDDAGRRGHPPDRHRHADDDQPVRRPRPAEPRRRAAVRRGRRPGGAGAGLDPALERPRRGGAAGRAGPLPGQALTRSGGSSGFAWPWERARRPSG